MPCAGSKKLVGPDLGSRHRKGHIKPNKIEKKNFWFSGWLNGKEFLQIDPDLGSRHLKGPF